MDKYLVDPFSRWIVHSTGWSKSKSIAWARTVIIVVLVVVASVAYFYLDPTQLWE